MCGINFIYSKKQPIEKKVIEQMMWATAHRGPDFSTFIHINSNTSIAHNRLSVIDLSDSANQPFVVNNRYFLSFNGELYNYRTLRILLEKEGLEFKTYSDTEVLTQLLIIKGEETISLLKGMFAFVFFDSQTNHIIAARDSYGIKPLFHYENDEVLIFSSEIKGIIASSYYTPNINKQGINDYLNFKYVTGNTTIYSNIISLHPNEVLTYKNNHSKKFFVSLEKLAFESKSISKLKTTVTDGIIASLTSDVPLGILLSGGIDSNLIYKTLKKYSSEKTTCFYINIDNDFKEQEELEKLTQSNNDELIKIDHLENFEINFHNYIRDLDYPIADSGGFLTWLLTKCAHEKGLKVVLSGAGGDEIFCGYNRHLAFHYYLKMRTIIPFKLLMHFPFTYLFSKNNSRLIKKVIGDLDSNPTATWANFVRLSLPQKHQIVLTEEISSLDHALLHDQENYLTKDVLSITDMASMANGVEVRVPLLYNQYNISANILLKKGKKWILKEILNSRTKSKKGFGIHLTHKLLETPLIANLISALESPQHYIYSYLEYDKTQSLIQQHRNEKNDYSPELWSLIILICWLDSRSLSV